jgi:hypothetical protein
MKSLMKKIAKIVIQFAKNVRIQIHALNVMALEKNAIPIVESVFLTACAQKVFMICYHLKNILIANIAQTIVMIA